MARVVSESSGREGRAIGFPDGLETRCKKRTIWNDPKNSGLTEIMKFDQMKLVLYEQILGGRSGFKEQMSRSGQ
jgi:hypothetical protein